MKFITAPGDLSVVFTKPCPSCRTAPNKNITKTLSFSEWLMTLLDDPKFWKNPKDSRSSVKLGLIIEGIKAGEEFGVEDNDYDRMMTIYNDPTFTFHPEVAKATCVNDGFMDALENPSDKPRLAEVEEDAESAEASA